MSDTPVASVRDILLTRSGVAFVRGGANQAPHDCVRAVELELAELGYAPSARLRDRLASCSLDELAAFRDATITALVEHIGAAHRHEPLFRRFPQDVPSDTEDLWWRKVLVHFLQAEGQPCLFCGCTGTTHVLNPCRHVVCDHCFDGANYSACPSCEHHVDRSSPFFKPTEHRARPAEKVVFQLLELRDNEEHEVRKLFLALCERQQALSPADRNALTVILREYKSRVLPWLPDGIPVRENAAIVFGGLFRECNADEVLPAARRFMTTATDVLRFIAVLSGTDGSLLRETVFKTIEKTDDTSTRFWGRIAQLIGASPPEARITTLTVPLRVCRFKVAKLPRSLRRALLCLLEGMDRDTLAEDMFRHRSYWVWIGEFLHPAEHSAKFPKVASAFEMLRKKSPDGAVAPRFQGWYSRLQKTVNDGDVDALLKLLNERPGEFARRLDFAVRLAGDDDRAIDRVVGAFIQNAPSFATPVLLTLRSHLPTRHARAKLRVYWPKGRVATGVSTTDERAVLPRRAIEPAVNAITAELLRRFAEKPAFSQCVIDEALRTVVVPFNERTASSAAVSLTRGSRIRVPADKTVRLFLHWCQPAARGRTTDLDLSVALYDPDWKYLGVCSYYQLQLTGAHGQLIAQSAGDLRDAPWPDGATEFVDLHCQAAIASGARFAVMVVNNYGGMPFSLLERGFAGLMLRTDTGGQHFDPRTVELKFALVGENGVFMPLVLDLQEWLLHWLDVQTKGRLEMNNVETSKAAIAKICPDLITYFQSGSRPSMYDLAMLHAAARCERVFVRGADVKYADVKYFERGPSEDRTSFHRRLLADASARRAELTLADEQPALAFLVRGDMDLPSESSIYALFRGRLTPTIAASDLLS